MRVCVCHNVARDDQDRGINWFGYEPGHPLVRVFEADVGFENDLGAEDLAEEIWIIGNAEPETLTGAGAVLARAYRARCLRSLSVGDVVVIGDGVDRTALSVDQAGFARVEVDSLTIVTTREHGTEPWPVGAPTIKTTARLPEIEIGGSMNETFHFLAYSWDVTAAQQIAADLPVHRFDPMPWFGWLGAVALDEDRIATADLERPIIGVKIAEANGAPLIIDGWHRIARAQCDGITELPVTILDEDQERQVRIRGGEQT